MQLAGHKQQDENWILLRRAATGKSRLAVMDGKLFEKMIRNLLFYKQGCREVINIQKPPRLTMLFTFKAHTVCEIPAVPLFLNKHQGQPIILWIPVMWK